ncbi:MAG: hypothetical protein M3M95_04725, partial [Pseudomonadota bacterium]|nr:hypothetical protein [Pseudomonadota bacterium]
MQGFAVGAAALGLLVPTIMSEPVSPLSVPAASMCQSAPQAAAKAAPAAEARPVLLEGFGVGGFKVTDHAEAQRWFDQGMATGFAFSHRETLRAFEEAQRLDPSCAMCAWGEAWARGPTINFGVDPAARTKALAALDRVAPRTSALSPKHQGMIAAMRVRYAEPAMAERKGADRAYAAAMERLADVHPDDDELAVLAADAIMIAGEGRGDGPGAPVAEANGASGSRPFARAAVLLERVLARNPEHTPAIHFHIHLTEWMGEARKAVAGADRLGGLAPSSGHLVHMPSHTFIRVGRYADAASVNAAAVEADGALARRTGLKAASEVPYHAHNLHFRTIAAIAAGDGRKALQGADAFMAAYPLPQNRGGYFEVMAASALFAHARYSNRAEIAALPEAAADRPGLRAARLYALGEAAAREGDLPAVKAQSSALRSLGGRLPSEGEPAQRVRRFTEMSRLILDGRAAMLERRWAFAARSFDRAADLQDRLGVDG